MKTYIEIKQNERKNLVLQIHNLMSKLSNSNNIVLQHILNRLMKKEMSINLLINRAIIIRQEGILQDYLFENKIKESNLSAKIINKLYFKMV